MASRTPTPDGSARERLPNLFEVLSRRTLAPVDLFSFYIYMRDVQRSVDYLDFWLDVSQHMSLCRHYVRELRRSVLVSTPDLEKAGSKRSSQVLDNYNLERDSSEQGPSGTYGSEMRKSTSDQRLSAFLRNDSGSHHSPKGSTGSNAGSDHRGEEPPRPSFMTGQSQGSSPQIHSNASPHHNVARTDIRSSAEKILYTFLLPGAEREIILPQGILTDITNAIEKEGRDDPEVFDDAKDYVFQAMERDAFPGFLRAKALGNIVQPSVSLYDCLFGSLFPRLSITMAAREDPKLTLVNLKMMFRLIFGLISLFAAFWAAFVLIFLNKDRATRCWLILPFTVGIYFLTSHQYMLDPILALLGLSEYTFLSFSRIKEPYVRKLLNKRATMCLSWIIIIDAALLCLFIFVPGKRL